MTDKPIETITVRLTAADYAAFNIYHGRWQLAGLFAFYCCLFVILLMYGGLLGEEPTFIAALALSVVISGLLVAFQLWRIRARTEKLFEKDNLSKLEQHIRLGENGMQHTAGDNTVHVSWEDILKAAETKHAIIMYLDRNKVVLLPKRDIPDLAGVLGILRKHLPASKLHLKAK
jgi:hypothetical protein